MIIEALGTGCAKCKQLHEATLIALTESGIQAEVRKTEDIAEILDRGVMSTPALVKDGKVLVAGRVPTPKGNRRLDRRLKFQVSIAIRFASKQREACRFPVSEPKPSNSNHQENIP